MKCLLCSKIYVNQGCYDKHVQICKWQQGDKGEASNQELCEIIQFLLKKCDNLEKDMVKLKQGYRVQAKVTSLDRLNQLPLPHLNWDEYMKQTVLSKEDFEYVCQNDFEKGFIKIVESHIKEDGLPIRAFKEQDKVIYIYTGKWVKMQSVHISTWMNRIQSKLSLLLREWCNSASKEDMERYDELVKCIYGFNYDTKPLISTLQRQIYTTIKK